MASSSENALVTAVKDIAAGSVGGALQVLVGHPLDTVKVCCQVAYRTTTPFDLIAH
jgi:hypothetical protein